MFERVFVTVGPTKNAYRLLIDQIMCNSAFRVYRQWNVKSVCLQGANGVPDQQLTFVKYGVNFVTYSYKESLIEDIQQADIVFCYAGDLIALKALELGKPVIMMKNSVCVDTRHLELAEVLAKEKYGLIVTVHDCFSKLVTCDPTDSLIPFPPMRRESFSEELWALLNKAQQQDSFKC